MSATWAAFLAKVASAVFAWKNPDFLAGLCKCCDSSQIPPLVVCSIWINILNGVNYGHMTSILKYAKIRTVTNTGLTGYSISRDNS
jgi:hypothetical protein